MDHFEDIQRLRELQTLLESLSKELSTALIERSQAESILAIAKGKVLDLSQRKATAEEAVRVEKIAIQNLPK